MRTKPSSPITSQLANHPWMPALAADGYTDICEREGQLCGIRRFNFTSAVVVGVDPVGYRRRYCYEHAHEARQALAAWDGKGHPGGPWIKCTGAGIELLNPALDLLRTTPIPRGSLQASNASRKQCTARSAISAQGCTPTHAHTFHRLSDSNAGAQPKTLRSTCTTQMVGLQTVVSGRQRLVGTLEISALP